MTKLNETMYLDESTGKLIVKEQHNFQAVAEKAKALKSAGVGDLGSDNKLVGLVPMKMWHEWAKKWGVKPSDSEAMREVVAREMMDSGNAHLRVWDGKF